jgi:hypothetical protein
MSRLVEIEFDNEDMKEVVEPAREVAVAFGEALFLTILKQNRYERDEAWKEFATMVCAFMKVT